MEVERGRVFRRCLRKEPHFAPHGCVIETREQSVVRTIREAINAPDDLEITGQISSHSAPEWCVTGATLGGLPLTPELWYRCVAAGLPMAAWDGEPCAAWQRVVLGRYREIGKTLDPIAAAQAVVDAWEAGGISHRLAGHLFDLREALRKPATQWLDRLPTPAEVEAHAKAHPVIRNDHGAWMVRWKYYDGYRCDVRWLCAINDVIDEFGGRASISYLSGEQWRPLTADGEPAPLPVP